MPKKIIAVLLLLVAVFPCSKAQNKMGFGKVNQIDTSKLVYHYIYSFKEKGIEEKARMILQIGTTYQRFSPHEYHLWDSLAFAMGSSPQDKKTILNKMREITQKVDLKGDVKWVLYSNYPAGKRTITDRVFTDSFSSEEEDTLPKWQLLNEQKEIAGRLCSKATTSLYGREWVVWYSEKDKRPDGPWLLKGLPGVVVRAEDSTGSFSFQLYKIEQRSTPIVYLVKDYFKASRNDVLKAKKRYYDNKAQYAAGTAAGQQMSDLPKTEAVPYTPLRRIKQ